MSNSRKSYRYQFPTKAIKGDCPSCAPRHRKTLSRYIDTHTGDVLPDEYGRCDRESNCTYHLSPYDQGPSGISYADEVYQQWKATQGRQFDSVRPFPASPRQATAPKPAPTIHTIPDEYFTRSLGHYEINQFARLLVGRFGQAKASELLQQFRIGTSTHWKNAGANVFWLVDEEDRVRGGQVKLFGDDWHTAKYVDREGRTRSNTSWVHSILQWQFERRQESVPQWLVDYGRDADKSPCLFGLPQLKTAPPDQPVAIVESPKTAVICAAFLTGFVWLAVMGKSYLKPERLVAVRNRRIVLYPDLNACYDTINDKGRRAKGWLTIAEELRTAGFNVEVSDYLETRATDEQKQAGLDLADFLLMPEVEPMTDSPEPTQLTTSPALPVKSQTFHQWSKSNWAFQHLGIRDAA